MAPLDEFEVTCASDTITIAIIAITPIGITLRMMATIVVRKMATRSQALSFKPAGVGVSSSVTSTTVVMMAGVSRKGTTDMK